MKTKICTKCKIEKDLSQFYEHRVNSGKLRSQCKKCCNERQTKREREILEKRKLDKLSGKIEKLEGVKVCSGCRKEKDINQFSKDNGLICGVRAVCKQCNKEYAIEWAKNKDYIDNRNKRNKERYYSDQIYRLKLNLRSRINLAIKNKSKSGKIEELLGCSIDYLKSYLESKFLVGMSWENRSKWHIDHIKPCDSFDLSEPDQQKQCFHYTNLQPLWVKDNLMKSNKLNFKLENDNE